jgi:hypothetical protein
MGLIRAGGSMRGAGGEAAEQHNHTTVGSTPLLTELNLDLFSIRLGQRLHYYNYVMFRNEWWSMYLFT